MLNAEADLGSEDEDEDEADVRPVKRLRARSPSPHLDEEEGMIAGIVADEEHAASDDGGDNDANNFGLSDDIGNEGSEDLDVGDHDFGGGVNNGVISLSITFSDDI